LVHIEFDAPLDPYTAFDFVELSLFQIAENREKPSLWVLFSEPWH